MNTESDTPRTDEVAMPIDRIDTIASRPCNVVHEDVCRQLERELNALMLERNNLNASLTAAISSSNARHFESMEHEAKSKQLERELNQVRKDLKRALHWIDDGIDQEGRDLIVNPMRAKYFSY
jgi:ABC-type phosphate transport system auxiliary subunit